MSKAAGVVLVPGDKDKAATSLATNAAGPGIIVSDSWMNPTSGWRNSIFTRRATNCIAFASWTN